MSMKFEILKNELLHDGFLKLQRLTLQHALFEGGTSRVLVRELMLRIPAAAVLVVDLSRQCCLLVEQFRVGAHQADNPWCLELIAGLADKAGEPVTELIRREALEEAGVAVGRLEQITTYYPSPGGSNEQVTLFVGEADLSAAGGVHGQLEEGEDIRSHLVPLADIPQLLGSGRINNAATLIALQWWLLNGERLCQQWL